MAVKANWESIERFQAREGVTRRVFSGERCMMVLNEIMPGTEASVHHHPHEQLLYIIQGSARVTLGDEALTMGEGDVLLVPPNVPHGLQSTSNQPVLNLDVFSPIREDYLHPDTPPEGKKDQP